MKYTKKLKSQKKEWASLMIILWSLCIITPFAEAQIGGTNTGALVIGADSTYITGNIVNQSTGRIYFGKNEHGKMTKCLILTGNYEGVEGSEIHLSAISPSNHGYFKISGTATGSTKIILDLDKDWNGDRINLVEATKTGSIEAAFTMDATTAAITAKTAVLKSDTENGKRYWYITEAGVTLNLKVFLEAPMTNSINGSSLGDIMNNYAQTADPNYCLYSIPRLPITYSMGGASATYPQINDVNGVAGAVTDWILVEIWRIDVNAYTRTILESKVLLLKPNGQVVDVTGETPVFAPQTGAVRIIVRHRCHLGVMSNEIANFSGAQTCDFTNSLSKAFSYPLESSPMLEINPGVYAMWAGEVVEDGEINGDDRTFIWNDFNNRESDKYIKTDLNMDGEVNGDDYFLVNKNFKKVINSPLFYFY